MGRALCFNGLGNAQMLAAINGGAHANNGLDIQEFMIVPAGFSTFSDSLRAGVEIFQELKKILDKEGHSTAVGDEGGFAPNLNSNEEALNYISKAVSNSGYKLGEEIFFALDVAATEIYAVSYTHLTLPTNREV